MAVLSPTVITRWRSPNRWLVLALAPTIILILVWSVFYSLKACQQTAGQAPSRSAFLRWYPQIQELTQGVDVYEKYNYPNPPIMALLLRPLTCLPPVPAALAWFYLKAALTIVAVRWLFVLVQVPAAPFAPWAMALTVALGFRSVLGDLSHGNVNLFILFLIVGALLAYSRGHDWLAGTVLGLAIACKVTPALFIPYFLWKRSWKCLGGCAVGLVLFLLVVPAGVLGEETNLRDLASWGNSMVRPFLVEGRVFYSEHNNQSLPGLLARLATHSPSFTTYEGERLVPTHYHNLLDLSPRLVGGLVKGLLLVFLAVAALSCRPRPEPRQGWRFIAECSLVVLGMLLFSERTWKHHCVTLLLPFSVISYYLAAFPLRPALRGYLISTLVAVVLLMTTTSTLRDDGGEMANDLGKLAQVYGAYVWAYLLLMGAVLAMLWAREPELTASGS